MASCASCSLTADLTNQRPQQIFMQDVFHNCSITDYLDLDFKLSLKIYMCILNLLDAVVLVNLINAKMRCWQLA